MKKIFSILLSIILAVGVLSGCSMNAGAKNSTNVTARQDKQIPASCTLSESNGNYNYSYNNSSNTLTITDNTPSPDWEKPRLTNFKAWLVPLFNTTAKETQQALLLALAENIDTYDGQSVITYYLYANCPLIADGTITHINYKSNKEYGDESHTFTAKNGQVASVDGNKIFRNKEGKITKIGDESIQYKKSGNSSKMIFYDPHCYINYDELGRIKSFVDNRAGAVGITTTYKYSGNNTLPTSIVIEEDGGEGDQTTATITLFIEGDNVSRININTNGSYNSEFSYQYQTLF